MNKPRNQNGAANESSEKKSSIGLRGCGFRLGDEVQDIQSVLDEFFGLLDVATRRSILQRGKVVEVAGGFSFGLLR